jgi:antitoxin (DNA-binding transcriptional repressor) of toxin-antitoxin stability system
MPKDLVHISEAEAAATSVAPLSAQVRAGAEVVIENRTRPVAVLRSADNEPGRLPSESIVLAEAPGSDATLDGNFGRDLEKIIASHGEPLALPSWDWLVLDSSVVIAAEHRGIIVPFSDLLIGATTREVGYALLTVNLVASA